MGEFLGFFVPQEAEDDDLNNSKRKGKGRLLKISYNPHHQLPVKDASALLQILCSFDPLIGQLREKKKKGGEDTQTEQQRANSKGEREGK